MASRLYSELGSLSTRFYAAKEAAKMLRLVLVLIVWLFLGVCVAADSLPTTFADSLLQRDTLRHVTRIDSALDPACKGQRELVDTVVVKAPQGYRGKNGILLTGGWTERWTLERCGRRALYTIEFTADGRGGTFMRVSIEPSI